MLIDVITKESANSRRQCYSLVRIILAINTMTIRSFVALPIPHETANQLGDVAAKMSYQDKSGAVRWVDQENYHITLAFLGEQHEADLETLAEQLDYHIRQTGFQAILSHVSPFPENRPKLLAAMIDKSDNINSLQRQVISAIKSTHMLIDKRKFIPHVTLGRYRHSRNAYAGGIPMNVSFELFIDEVVLFESVLTTSGAEYQPIYRFPLDSFLDQSDEYYGQQKKAEYALADYKEVLIDEG
jgi:2'-5' RNA ligase